jgi:alkanesulfonate monooxygenase SsuD/methylene tetrahydromethanopterin reductase-like flavin-dependent oxidoreductase (luciferase family)
MPSIASSATSVLIAHVGARTTSIRLGALTWPRRSACPTRSPATSSRRCCARWSSSPRP